MATTTQHFGRQLIGPAGNPFMMRYILFRWGNLPRVYVHKFLRSDDERAPHNHPWWFMSFVLRGWYLEYTDTPPNPHVRKQFSLAYRGLDVFHRVALPQVLCRDGSYGPVSCWTLVVTGPDVRSWGFRCPQFAKDIWDVVTMDQFDRILRGERVKVADRVVHWSTFDGCGE